MPSHWRVVPAKAVLTLARSLVGPNWKSTPLLSLTRRGVIVRDIDSGLGKFPASFDDYQHVWPGDLVFCLFDIDETPRTVGLVETPGMVTGAYTRFEVKRELADPRYLEYFYIAIDDEKRFRPLYTGLRNAIKKDRFMSAGIALPALGEQIDIVREIDARTGEIDRALSAARRSTKLAIERRAALISAAVTGKIDVGVVA